MEINPPGGGGGAVPPGGGGIPPGGPGWGAPPPLPPSGGARQAVGTPALLLIITGAIGILGALFNLVTAFFGSDPAAAIAQNPDLEQLRGVLEMMHRLGPVSALLNLAASGFVLFGGLRMRDLRGYGLAVAASIVAIIPCWACCCIGIPAGIWSLVVLMRPEVKASFRP